MRNVNIIKAGGEAVVVEYVFDNAVKRCTVPRHMIVYDNKRAQCDDFTLSAGIPFGINWEGILGSNIDFAGLIERMANALRKHGVWTITDVTPQTIFASLQEAYGLDVHTILKLISQGKGE